MEVLSYACAALTAEPIVAAVNQNLHLAGAAEAGEHFTKLYSLLKPYRLPGLGVPPTVALGVQAVQRALTDEQARAYLAGQLGPGGVRAITMVLQAAGGPQRDVPSRIDNSEPAFGDTERTMIQAAPAQYPSGVNVRNNFGGPIDLRRISPNPPTPAPVAAHPGAPPAPPVPAQPVAQPAPAAAGWGVGHPSAAPVAAAVDAVARPPLPDPRLPPPIPAKPGERAMPPDVAALVNAAVAEALAKVNAANPPAPPAPTPPPTPTPTPVIVKVVPKPPPPKPEPKTPWGKRGTSLADYTFQVVTALTHLFAHGKLHLAWNNPEWSTSSYGLEWGWVRVTTTTEAEAILLRLPPEEVSAEARAAVAKPRGLHRHKELPAILEALGKLGEFPEIARSLQLEHYTTRVYSPADDVARGFAEVRPVAWLIAANAVRLGGALAIRHEAFPDGAGHPTDWIKWLDAQEKQHRAADKPAASLETLRLLATENPMLDFSRAVEVIDDLGRIHEVTAQSIFSPTAVLKGGKAE